MTASRRFPAMVAAAWAIALLATLPGGAARPTRTFTDPAADAGAPDITNVVIVGDPASGTVRISVTAGGLFAIDRGSEPDVSVWLDTDRDRSTGSASGCEYGLKFWNSPTGVTWHLLRWNDTEGKWEVSPPSPTASFASRGDVLTWRFGTADIGGATGFQFWLASAVYSDNQIAAEDVAPFDARWSYELSATPVTFRDPTHDATAPDIRTIAIGSSPAGGVTTVSVTARGLSAIARTLKPDVDVYLDADRNESTGSYGADYRLGVSLRPGRTVWHLYRWNSRTETWRATPTSRTLGFTRRGDTVTWRFGPADIGSPKSFRFSLASAIYIGGEIIEDFAPNWGWWTYVLPAVAPKR